MNRLSGLEPLIVLAALAWVALIAFILFLGKRYQSNKTKIID